MSLPAKALQVLADLKKDLLSRDESPVIAVPPAKETKSTQVMRHAKSRGRGWQNYCRTGRW